MKRGAGQRAWGMEHGAWCMGHGAWGRGKKVRRVFNDQLSIINYQLTNSCKASGGGERTGNLKPETRSKKLFGGK
jgi:hypothetical protein